MQRDLIKFQSLLPVNNNISGIQSIFYKNKTSPTVSLHIMIDMNDT